MADSKDQSEKVGDRAVAGDPQQRSDVAGVGPELTGRKARGTRTPAASKGGEDGFSVPAGGADSAPKAKKSVATSRKRAARPAAAKSAKSKRGKSVAHTAENPTPAKSETAAETVAPVPQSREGNGEGGGEGAESVGLPASPVESNPSDDIAPRTKAPLEHRVVLEGEEIETFQQNYDERRRLEEVAEMSRESEFAASWHGRLFRWRVSRWLFDRETRHLEKLILVGVGIAILGVAHSTLHSTRELKAVGATTVVEALPGLGEELLHSREASERLITRFFQAKSMEEVLPVCRHPEILEPVMTRWYQSHPHRQEAGIEFAGVTIKTIEGSRYLLHDVLLEGDLEPRPIAVEETPEGFRVDWETAVGYQAIDWTELGKIRPTTPFYLRVIVQPHDYYNFEFQDETVWESFRLYHPDADKSLYGYVKKHSPLFHALTPERAGTAEYFILKLRYPENSRADDLVLIEDIFQKKWVRLYEPGETHFDEG